MSRIPEPASTAIMSQQQIFGFLILALAGSGLHAAEGSFEFSSEGAVTRGADLTGRVVETRDGQELGRVHDFAIDLTSGRVGYVVVSVGSFLIDDSLIAVAPDALRESADADGRLILETDAETLRDARRFSPGDWPRQADVVASAATGAAAPGAGAEQQADESGTAPLDRRGTATISDGNKTATLSAGERSIRFDNPPSQPPSPADPVSDAGDADASQPTTPFDRLDRNGDGTLDRAEIAHQLSRDDRFADIDTDGSGTVDREEFEALIGRRAGGE